MKKMGLLLPVLLLLSSCSWLSELMVFNKSQHTVAVRYTVTGQGDPLKPIAYHIEKWTDSIPSLGDTVHVYSRRDAATGEFYVELPANTALVIAQDINRDMRDRAGRLPLLTMIKSLTIVSPNDAQYICSDSTCDETIVAISKARAGIVFGD